MRADRGPSGTKFPAAFLCGDTGYLRTGPCFLDSSDNSRKSVQDQVEYILYYPL